MARAKLWELAGKPSQALSLYESICQDTPTEVHIPALFSMAAIHTDRKELVEARDCYLEIINHVSPTSAEWEKAARALSKINQTLIFSIGMLPEQKQYTVKKGDTLVEISKKLNVSRGMLIRTNKLKDNGAHIQAGQKLYYVPKDFRIIIEKNTNRLYLLDSKGLFAIYSADIHVANSFKKGKFRIGNKYRRIPSQKSSGNRPQFFIPLIPVTAGISSNWLICSENTGRNDLPPHITLQEPDMKMLYDLVVRATPVQFTIQYAWGKK